MMDNGHPVETELYRGCATFSYLITKFVFQQTLVVLQCTVFYDNHDMLTKH